MKQIIEIEVPDGFEAKYNPDNNRVELVKKNTKPKTWEEYANSIDGVNMWYILGGSSTIEQVYITQNSINSKRNLINSKEEAEAFVALMQLRQLRKAWVGNWQPIYSRISNPNPAWHIHYENEQVVVDQSILMQRTLSFPTIEMAKEFLGCFKELVKKAKPLI